MKKILFRKFLIDYLTFFFMSLTAVSIIIWVFQSVNYLDIIIEDGRDYLVYLKYCLYALPKIVSKLIPFAAFFSLSYIIVKYENNNELIIFWNFGVNKIILINFFILIAFALLIIQFFLTIFLVPKTQDLARTLFRNSEVSFLENFIKEKKFNDIIKDLTIHTDSKNSKNIMNNIYLKRNFNGNENFEITYAKKGEFKTVGEVQILTLYNGESISGNMKNLTNFNFSKTDIVLKDLSSDVMKVIKTQENSSKDLMICVLNLRQNNSKGLLLNKKINVQNCNLQNLKDIFRELYKRVIAPTYIVVLILIASLLVMKSKENIGYNKFKILIFILGFSILVFSEISLRFINNSLEKNYYLILFPVLLFLSIYTYIRIINKFRKL